MDFAHLFYLHKAHYELLVVSLQYKYFHFYNVKLSRIFVLQLFKYDISAQAKLNWKKKNNALPRSSYICGQ